jgi:hypothetical protein
MNLHVFTKILSEMNEVSGMAYGFITGGALRGRVEGSDIDTVIVCRTKPEISDIQRFIERSKQWQLEGGYTPDPLFPTEIMSMEQVDDCVIGRAFTLRDSTLTLSNYSDEFTYDHPEACYRYWLYMFASHDMTQVIGDLDTFQRDTDRVLETLFLFTADVNGYGESIERGTLARQLLESGGNAKYSVHPLLVDRLIDRLVECGLATVCAEEIRLDTSLLQSKIDALKARVAYPFRAEHWFSYRDLAVKL